MHHNSTPSGMYACSKEQVLILVKGSSSQFCLRFTCCPALEARLFLIIFADEETCHASKLDSSLQVCVYCVRISHMQCYVSSLLAKQRHAAILKHDTHCFLLFMYKLCHLKGHTADVTGDRDLAC